MTIGNESFTILAAVDIGIEKGRQSLEHIFLHDTYNVAYGLSWYTDFLKKAEPEQGMTFQVRYPLATEEGV